MAPSLQNTTNQQRIARALHRATGCGYQKALHRVQDAAAAGRLPARLDQAGRQEAIRILTHDHHTQAVAAADHAPADVTPTPGKAAGPHKETQPLPAAWADSVLLDVVRGGPDKTLHQANAPAPRDGHTLHFDLGDAPESLTEEALATLLSMDRIRGLQRKEETVERMRAERDEQDPWDWWLPRPPLPDVPQHVAEQIDHMLRQTPEQP